MCVDPIQIHAITAVQLNDIKSLSAHNSLYRICKVSAYIYIQYIYYMIDKYKCWAQTLHFPMPLITEYD